MSDYRIRIIGSDMNINWMASEEETRKIINMLLTLYPEDHPLHQPKSDQSKRDNP